MGNQLTQARMEKWPLNRSSGRPVMMMIDDFDTLVTHSDFGTQSGQSIGCMVEVMGASVSNQMGV